MTHFTWCICSLQPLFFRVFQASTKQTRSARHPRRGKARFFRGFPTLAFLVHHVPLRALLNNAWKNSPRSACRLIYLSWVLFAIQTLNFAWATCDNVYFQQKTVCKFAGTLDHTSLGVLCDKNHTLGFCCKQKSVWNFRKLLRAQTLHFVGQTKRLLVLDQFGPLCGYIGRFIYLYIFISIGFI